VAAFAPIYIVNISAPCRFLRSCFALYRLPKSPPTRSTYSWLPLKLVCRTCGGFRPTHTQRFFLLQFLGENLTQNLY